MLSRFVLFIINALTIRAFLTAAAGIALAALAHAIHTAIGLIGVAFIFASALAYAIITAVRQPLIARVVHATLALAVATAIGQGTAFLIRWPFVHISVAIIVYIITYFVIASR